MPIANLIIRLKDESSRGINRIGNSLAGLAGKANQAASGTAGLAGAIRRGVLEANAIGFAANKAGQAIGFLGDQFQEASRRQTQSLATVSAFSALTGLNAKESTAFMADLNKELSTQAKDLAGTAEGYKSLAAAISDNLVSAFKDVSGKVDLGNLKDSLTSLSVNYGVLTDSSTKDVGNTGLFLSKFLSGQLDRSLSFVEGNPAVIGEIDRRLAESGKALKDLSLSERVKILQQSAEKFVTDEFKTESAKTVDALLSSLSDTLFGADIGWFNIGRDLNEKLEGNQSVFTSLNKSLLLTIGPDGVFTKMGSILQQAGIKFADPMVALMNGIDALNSGIERVNRALGHAQNFLASGHSLAETLMAIPSFLGLDGLGTFKLTVGAGLVTAALGAAGHFALMKSGFIGAAVSARSFAFSIGGKAIEALRTFGLGIQSTVMSIPGMVRSLKQGTIAAGQFVVALPGKIGQSLNQGTIAVGRFVASLPGRGAAAFQGFVSGISGMVTALRGLTVGSVLAGAKTAITAFVTTVRVAGMGLLLSPIGLAITAIGLAALLIYKYWDPLKNFFTGFFSGLMQGLQPVMPAFNSLSQSLTGALGPAFQFIGGLIQPVIRLIGSLLKPVQDSDGSWRSFGETLGGFVAGAIVGTVNLVKWLIDVVGQGIAAIDEFIAKGRKAPGAVGWGFRAVFGEGEQSVGASYSGHIGNAAGGFVSSLVAAAQREQAYMPAGSRLMLANSSETIIPGGLLGQFASAVAPAPVPVAVSTRAGTSERSIQIGPINVYGGSSDDAQTIADRVVATIQQRFEFELNAQLI